MRRRVICQVAISILALVLSSSLAAPALAQDADTTRYKTDVGGSVTITNKGISIIPAFTLGKPAAILDVSIQRRGLSFEPQFRYGLDGKPWSFLFWGRYKLLEREKLRVTIGAHPALNFRTTPVSINGTAREVIVARRYLAGELSPSYLISNSVGVGAYYLYSHGMENDITRNTHYIALRSVLTGVLARGYSVRLAPQAYYLRMDSRDGYYLSSTLTLARRNLPVSISVMASGPIRTAIAEGNNVLWNVSANYSIN